MIKTHYVKTHFISKELKSYEVPFRNQIWITLETKELPISPTWLCINHNKNNPLFVSYTVFLPFYFTLIWQEIKGLIQEI